MTTAKKIEILNNHLDRLQVSEATLNTFHVSNWKTETLEYIRVFFGEDSELYKKCKKYNDDVDEEYKTKTYLVGSALWIMFYSDILFSAMGILQHELYKKSIFSKLGKGITTAIVISGIGVLMTAAFYVGKADGIKLGQSCVIVKDSAKNIPQQKRSDTANEQPKQKHNDTFNK